MSNAAIPLPQAPTGPPPATVRSERPGELFRNDPDPVYVVAVLRLHDFEWVEEYDRYVPSLVEEFGGRFITRTGAIVGLAGEVDPPCFVDGGRPSLDGTEP